MAYQIKKDPISKIPKVQLAFWLLVRLAMLICAGYSFIHGDTVMGFESIFCFIFTHLWDLFQIFGNGSFIEEVPPLSQTLLNIIIFIGIVFGSYLELFDKLAHFDDFMHLLSGFVCAAFGFDFARIIQRKKGPCAVTLAAIFGLMFAVTIAAGWEFYEFLMDTLHGTNGAVLEYATIVKLTRTLAIIPTVLVFAAISVHLKKKAAAQSGDHGVKVNMKSVFPWFILGFLAMSILCSVGVIPAGLATTLKSISKFLMVAALAAIGLNTNFAALCKSGAKPMLHGFIISLLVVLVAIAVEYVLGIAPSGTLI